MYVWWQVSQQKACASKGYRACPVLARRQGDLRLDGAFLVCRLPRACSPDQRQWKPKITSHGTVEPSMAGTGRRSGTCTSTSSRNSSSSCTVQVVDPRIRYRCCERASKGGQVQWTGWGSHRGFLSGSNNYRRARAHPQDSSNTKQVNGAVARVLHTCPYLAQQRMRQWRRPKGKGTFDEINLGKRRASGCGRRFHSRGPAKGGKPLVSGWRGEEQRVWRRMGWDGQGQDSGKEAAQKKDTDCWKVESSIETGGFCGVVTLRWRVGSVEVLTATRRGMDRGGWPSWPGNFAIGSGDLEAC
ncbi:hypothetical protein GGI42DRAFT_287814 [Trichoderma sp. SZMC 28013]